MQNKKGGWIMMSEQGMEKNIRLNKYPNLKLGFTTANFAKFLPPIAINIKLMIDFANKEGFSFIELRDPAADLNLSECADLAIYARQKKVEVIYAVNVGAMDPTYFDVLSRAIGNSLAFDGPKMIRTGANGPEFVNEAKKLYWTEDDFRKLVQNLNDAGDIAEKFGLKLSVENAREGLQGDGVQTFGTAELFGRQGVDANVGWQLDTANFFTVSRVNNDPNAVKEFFEQHVDKIDYTHLKSSQNGQPQPVIGQSDLPLNRYLDLLNKNNKVYVALELPALDTLEIIYSNHCKSIAYLNHSL